MSAKRLIIFDCDGVLVDTETRANSALAGIVTAAGLPMTMEESRQRFVGMSMTSVRDTLRRTAGIDLGDDFPTRWQADLPTVFGDGVVAIPGIEGALDRLVDAGFAVCVASSGTVAKMHLTLGSAGLLDRLRDVLFSATMVRNGKPAPDLFLHAAQSMGFPPEACLVVEDSPLGAQAAQAADMACIGYAGDPLTDRDGLESAGARIITAMADLPTIAMEWAANP